MLAIPLLTFHAGAWSHRLAPQAVKRQGFRGQTHGGDPHAVREVSKMRIGTATLRCLLDHPWEVPTVRCFFARPLRSPPWAMS